MPSSRGLPNPEMESKFPMSLALADGFFTTSATWEVPGAQQVRVVFKKRLAPIFLKTVM